MNEFEKEKKKLKDVVSRFNTLIDEYEIKIEQLPSRFSDNPYLLEQFFSMYFNKMKLLEKVKEKPYFARIDFKIDKEDKIRKCYLSKVGVEDENNEHMTIDWRAPIASVYYDSNVGRASYEAPEGTITGDLLLKRQYDIENEELLSFRDVDTVSNDDILKPYLNVNADNRLKNIIASIQTEQNEIIRENLNKNLIIQGVAGSGKTTVALHRVAYLVYNYINSVNPEQYLVIGPNKFFINIFQACYLI
ncbi:MAG: UvrD-helicase domain-containing protein [Bacilli bacterium]